MALAVIGITIIEIALWTAVVAEDQLVRLTMLLPVLTNRLGNGGDIVVIIAILGNKSKVR